MNALLENFKVLHEELKELLSLQQPEEDILQKKIKKYIGYMAEDHRNKKSEENLFDYFCENNGNHILAGVLQKNSFIAIKAYSLLFINLKDEIWVNYILCQPFVKAAIEAKCDIDEQQWTQYYISFLKSLSIRLNQTQIAIFYNKKHCTYPIVYEAMKYFNHPDFMVRTSVMNIVLELMKSNFLDIEVQDQNSRQYFSRFPFSSYLVTFACEVYQLISTINSKLTDKSATSKQIQNYSVDISDYLQYYNDLIKFGTGKAVQVIRSCFDAYLLAPIFQMMMSENDIEVKHSLLLLIECTKIIKDKNIFQSLITTLLKTEIDLNLANHYREQKEIYFPLVHQQKFNSQHFYWDLYKNDIINHCLEVFDHIQQFQVDYEITHHKNPDFLAQIKNISDFIGFNLLQNRSMTDMHKVSSLVQNPFRMRLVKLLQSKDEILFSLTLSLVYRLSQNVLVSLDNESQLTNIILQRILVFNQKVSSLTQLQNQVKFIYILKDKPIALNYELQLTKKYKEVGKQLMGYVTKENLNEVVNLFSFEFKKINDRLSLENIDFGLTFVSCLSKAHSQENKERTMMNHDLKKEIDQQIKLFWIFFILTNKYMKQHHHKTINFSQQYSRYFQEDAWKVGQRYKIKNKKTIACNFFSEDLKKPIQVTIIEDPANFIITSAQSNTTDYQIKMVSSWIQVSFEMKRDDPTTIETSVCRADGNITFYLLFEDQVRSCNVLESFKEVKGDRQQKQLSFIHNFLKRQVGNE